MQYNYVIIFKFKITEPEFMITLRNFTCEDIPVLQKNGYDKYSYAELCSLINKWQNDKTYDNLYFEMFAICNGDENIGNASLFQKSNSIISCGLEIYPEYQKKGYGSAAYYRLLDLAKAKGYAIASAQVETTNTASINLNLKLGFETDNYEYINKKGKKVYIFIKSLI